MPDMEEYGFAGGQVWEDGLWPARVTELSRGRYRVISSEGEFSAALSGKFYHGEKERQDFPAVGDFVLIRRPTSRDAAIVRVLPRFSKFSRADFSGHAVGYAKTVREQVIAANFDYVFIMTSLNQDFNLNRIVRYMLAAIKSGAKPVVILTKADLVEDASPKVAQVLEAFPGVEVHPVSSRTGMGMQALLPYAEPGKTIVFLGMSGVGKSSLLNSLYGKEVMRVREIREDDSRGRHTTTHRQLVKLPSGALVIDTPGLRELGLWDVEEGARQIFEGIEALFAHCRFSNCTHEREPGCAVQAALSEGTLSPQRWESYLAQQRESMYTKGKRAREKTDIKQRKQSAKEKSHAAD